MPLQEAHDQEHPCVDPADLTPTYPGRDSTGKTSQAFG